MINRPRPITAIGAILLLAPQSLLAGAPTPTRAPLGMAREELLAWRDNGFETTTPDAAAAALGACLGHPDPTLRDQIGYEGLAALLRAGLVSADQRRRLIDDLVPRLDGRETGSVDPAGVAAPFAALALAEIVRTDRIEPFLDERELNGLVYAAAKYLSGISDYRAFDEQGGWRHGVAHGADFILQLTVNERTTLKQLRALRDAIAAQVSPPAGVAYVRGETNRLARPIAYMARRGLIGEDEWSTWLEAVANPAPLANWGEAFQSNADLDRVHNIRGFALALYAYASSMDGEGPTALSQAAIRVAGQLL
ncbi:MAG: DUF2785 domain-containing protein [Alphaproteobacteria bacterium]|nr:DUF2785 domain-containing protein [Alphaproteobacteria bacterium]